MSRTRTPMWGLTPDKRDRVMRQEKLVGMHINWWQNIQLGRNDLNDNWTWTHPDYVHCTQLMGRRTRGHVNIAHHQ